MKRIIKKIGYISSAIFLFLLLLLVVASLLFYYDKPLTRNILQKYASDKSGVKIEIGKLNYGLFPLNIHFSSVKISQKTKDNRFEVFIKKLHARGGLKSLLKKRKPIFELIELEGGDFRINQTVSGEIDLRKMISKLEEALGYVKKIVFKDVSFDLRLPSQNITLQNARLTLSKSPQEKTYVFSLECKSFGGRQSDPKISFETGLSAAGEFSLSERVLVDANIRFSTFRFAAPGIDYSLKAVAVRLNGEFKAGEKILKVPQFAMDIPNLVHASGAVMVNFNKNLYLNIHSVFELADLDYALNYLRLLLPQKFKTIGLNGKASGKANFLYVRDSREKSNIGASLKLEPTKVEYSAPGFSLQTLVSGEFSLGGPLSNIQISSKIWSNRGNLATKNMQIKNLSFDLNVKAGKDSAQFASFKTAVGSVAFTSGKKPILFDNVEMNGSGAFEIPHQSLHLDSLEVRLPGMPTLQSSARIDLSPRGEKYLKLSGLGIKLGMIRNLFSDFMPKNLEGWEFESSCDFEAEVRNSPQKKDEWDFAARLNLMDGKFQDSSFTVAGETLRPIIELKGKYDLSKKSILLSGTFSLAQGESLWKDFYINWGKNPVDINFAGVYSIPSNQLDEVSLNASMPTLGEIHAQGAANIQTPFSLKLEAASRLNLASLYSLISKGETNDKSQMNIKGEAETRMNLARAKDTLSIEGDFELKEGAIENQNAGFYVQGLQAKVPFYFVMGNSAKNKEESPSLQKGYFRAKEFKTPYFAIAPLELTIQHGENSFQVEPLSVGFFGGVAELGKVFLTLEPQTLSFNGNFSLRLKDLDLSQFPLENKQFSLKGSAQAELPQIEIGPQKLTAQGEVKVDIFGGQVIVRKISITNPFSKERTLAFDVDLKNIDLERLTDTVPFGRVTGIINGEIKDLAISYGQPESFDLRVESVKKKGVSQKFSLKAVNNLSVLSSGEKTSLPSSKWWMCFVSGFRYEKIGIWSTLKNDMVTLRGTIVEKGVEYLVRRSRFFGIDVINWMPNAKISFRDMSERLKRIEKSKESE